MATASDIRDARFDAAIELASAGASSYRRTARRFSICVEDAEDAYQRGLEILLTKAPTTDRAQLRPWLHTVIKHEALALRRQREKLLGPTGSALETTPGPDEQAPERERVLQTAEALGTLKQGEVQCMLLKALGYSYDEIAQRTGYSWTKVNRCLSEGRRSFFERFDEIRSGESCDRIGPALETAARTGKATDQQQVLDAHLRGCAICRADLRQRRTIASRAEVLSPVMLLAAMRGSWWERLHESVAGGVALKVGQVTELVGAHKVAAVAASTAALAGGMAAEKPVPVRHHYPVRAVADRTSGSQAESQPSRPQAVSVPERTDEVEQPTPPDKPAAPQPVERASSEFEPAAAPMPDQPPPPSGASRATQPPETEFTP